MYGRSLERVPSSSSIPFFFLTYTLPSLLMISPWASFRRSMWPVLNSTQTLGLRSRPSASYVTCFTSLRLLLPFWVNIPLIWPSLLAGCRLSVGRVTFCLILTPPHTKISKESYSNFLLNLRAWGFSLLKLVSPSSPYIGLGTLPGTRSSLIRLRVSRSKRFLFSLWQDPSKAPHTEVVNCVQVVSTMDLLSRYVYIVFCLGRSMVLKFLYFFLMQILWPSFVPKAKAVLKWLWPATPHLPDSPSTAVDESEKKMLGGLQHYQDHSVSRWHSKASTSSLPHSAGVHFTGGICPLTLFFFFSPTRLIILVAILNPQS